MTTPARSAQVEDAVALVGDLAPLIADPAAKWPHPASDWSQWSPGLWYHRE